MEQKEIVEFDITDLLPISMTLVVAGIGISYGLNVMGDVKTDMTANSAEANASLDMIKAVAKIPKKAPLIVTVLIAAIVIGILVRYLVMPSK